METIGQLALSRERGEPTEVERAFLESTILDLHGLESRTRGRFAETLIVHLLGGDAHQSTFAAAPWDICWDDRTIAVRATGQHNSQTEVRDGTAPKASSMRWSFPKRGSWILDPLQAVDEHGNARPAQRVWSDAVVLAIHRGTDIANGWTFIVLDGSVFDSRDANSLGITRALELSEHERELGSDELRGALESLFASRDRRPAAGDGFTVSCDDEVAHARAKQ